eukprot:3640990-Pleurochrysis_carterae.AAC.5
MLRVLADRMPFAQASSTSSSPRSWGRRRGGRRTYASPAATASSRPSGGARDKCARTPLSASLVSVPRAARREEGGRLLRR